MQFIYWVIRASDLTQFPIFVFSAKVKVQWGDINLSFISISRAFCYIREYIFVKTLDECDQPKWESSAEVW